MRKKELIRKIEELGNNFAKPDLNKTEALISEVLVFFDYIREKLKSPDLKDQESALADLQEVQKKLEEFSQKAVEASGMNPDQLANFMANPNNFKPEDWQKLQKIEGNVKAFNQNHH